MSTGYKIASVVFFFLFMFATTATFLGWNNPSEQEVKKARSVRTGSLHNRHIFGGSGK